ncbi:serine/threonine protein phosphatase, partial [Salmonella enterica subsp. enterica serovar Legon]
MLLRRENIEREQAIVSSSLRQGITLPWRSQLYFIAIITKY